MQAQNKVVSFSGLITSYSKPAPEFLPAANNFSFCAWIKPQGTGNRAIITWADSLGTKGIEFRLENDNRLYFLSNGTGAFTKCVASSVIAMNQWVHVGITLNSGVPSIYVNGESKTISFVSSTSPFPTPISSAFNNMQIGGFHHNRTQKEPFSGSMDDCCIFNSPLTATEIKSTMLDGPILSDVRLFGYYDFEDGLSLTEDLSLNSNNLNLVNVSIIRENVIEDKTIFSEFPKNKQLYPRDLTTNKAQIAIAGQDIARIVKSDSVILKLYKNLILQNTISTPLTYNNDTANFTAKFEINAELSNYSIKTYLRKSQIDKLVNSADSIVAGDAYIINGQSNAEAKMYSGTASVNFNSFIRVYGSGSDVSPYFNKEWYEVNPDGSNLVNGNIGQWGARLAKLILDKEQIPIAVLNGARSGKAISYFQRNAANPLSMSTNYGRLLLRAKEAGLNNSFRAIFWHQGETDGIYKKSISYYKGQFNTLFASWKDDYPSLEQFYSFQIKNACSGGTPESSAMIQEAQVQLADELPDLSIMSTSAGNNASATNCHFEYEAGYKLFGDWIFDLVSRDIYKHQTTKQIDAPQIRSITLISPDTILITTNDSLVVEPGSEDSFQFYANNVTVKSIKVQNTTNLKLVLSAPLVNVDSLTMYGCTCVDFPIIKNRGGVALLHFYKHTIEKSTTSILDSKVNNSGFYSYPTLVKNNVSFHYSIAENTGASLILYSVNGCSVKELFNKNCNPGEYHMKVNLSDLPIGLYLCKLKTNHDIITTKLIRVN